MKQTDPDMTTMIEFVEKERYEEINGKLLQIKFIICDMKNALDEINE